MEYLLKRKMLLTNINQTNVYFIQIQKFIINIKLMLNVLSYAE